MFARSFVGGMDDASPVTQGIEGAFEADAVQRDIVEVGSLLHEDSHEVVSDEMYLEFFTDHVGFLAAQHIETKSGFDVGEVKFYIPAFGVEMADGLCRIEGGIGERGGNCHGAGAKARSRNDNADQTHGELRGQFIPLRLRPVVLGNLRGFDPCYQSIS